MKKYTIKIGMLILGWTLIVLGIIGIFLPFLQGFIFLVIGSFILSRHSIWFAKKLAQFKTKYPVVGAKITKLETKMGQWTQKDATATREKKD